MGRESVLQLLPVGASVHPHIVASSRLPGIVNYLIGQHAHTDIPTYAEVTYQNLYPGISLAVHGARGGFEYDWLVQPRADTNRIALRVKGAITVRVDLFDLGRTACGDAFRVRTSSGYDTGTRAAAQISVTTP